MIGGLLVGAGLLWLSSRLAWGQASRFIPLHGDVLSPVSGSQITPALNPLAILALAAIAAMFAVGGWPRRVLGGLVGVIGLVAVALGVNQVWTAFASHPAGYPATQVLAGHLLAVVAGLLILAAGSQIVRHAIGLPRLGGNYQVPGAPRKRRDPDAELWQALSEGQDPTTKD